MLRNWIKAEMFQNIQNLLQKYSPNTLNNQMIIRYYWWRMGVPQHQLAVSRSKLEIFSTLPTCQVIGKVKLGKWKLLRKWKLMIFLTLPTCQVVLWLGKLNWESESNGESKYCWENESWWFSRPSPPARYRCYDGNTDESEKVTVGKWKLLKQLKLLIFLTLATIQVMPWWWKWDSESDFVTVLACPWIFWVFRIR